MMNFKTAFDPVIHAPARLQIMAVLMARGPDYRMEFTQLRRLLDLTDGNLGTHLGTLEHAGYVAIEKDFAGKRPRTRAMATSRGRQAYVDHVTALRALLDRSIYNGHSISAAGPGLASEI
jgi:DNA-binding MarR family transcriptional regulator